jgi:hypothetical protein
MTQPPRCTVCGDTLPDGRFHGATTCREYADALARRRGDTLDDATHADLMLLRLWCQLFAALRDGGRRSRSRDEDNGSFAR